MTTYMKNWISRKFSRKYFVIRKKRDILIRWKSYFEVLLNEKNKMFVRADAEPNEQLMGEVTRQEVE